MLPRKSEIRRGDLILGLPSSGIDSSNGLSLARKVIPVERHRGLEGNARADAYLRGGDAELSSNPQGCPLPRRTSPAAGFTATCSG